MGRVRIERATAENDRDADKVRLATGSYVGTGVFGASNPNSLTFDFVPKTIFVLQPDGGWMWSHNTGYYTWAVALAGVSNEYMAGLGFGYSGNSSDSGRRYAKKAKDGKTVYWYQTVSAWFQLNAAGVTYTYIAIG